MSIHNFEYLLVLFWVLIFPLIFSFHKHSTIKKDYFTALKAIFLVSIPWIIWDYFATLRGHWNFNSDFYLGFKILNLPFEEVMFFWVIPFACLFVWTNVRDFENWKDFWGKLTDF